MNKTNILVTGGCGFLGSHFIKMIIREHPDVDVVNLDALTAAGNLDNLKSVMASPRYHFVLGNICNERLVSQIIGNYRINGIVNFAAETNIFQSIEKPKPFVETNVSGTLTLLQQAVRAQIKRFLQVSTDKVYGECNETDLPDEQSGISPDSPYAASKSFADYFVQFFHYTHRLETVIARCTNCFGPNQLADKFIPLTFVKAQENRPVTVYGNGSYVRNWLHVQDHCRALWLVFSKGQAGEIYNIGGSKRSNLEVVKLILSYLGKTEKLIKFAQPPTGHGQCYGVSTRKISDKLGWSPSMKFDEGFIKTLGWYYNNDEWLEKITSGEYLKLYNQYYKKPAT